MKAVIRKIIVKEIPVEGMTEKESEAIWILIIVDVLVLLADVLVWIHG